ncbi:MAG: hypothetical protein IGR76_01565 [Synechococcales cyanobacterium T60_A2020_003]|nr:hypothetical protein [Synechococcales cyanobacterium T60_A2020_003]
MQWKSQLSKLILSFYREDPDQLHKIQCLSNCKLFRRWRVLRIHCYTEEDANALTQASAILSQPVALLKLARHIKIFLDGEPVAAIDIQSYRLPAQHQGDDADLLL